MQILNGILIFYKKPTLPALVVALVFGILVFIFSGRFSFAPVAIAYLPLSVLFHYFIYEVINPREYYFYYNMGLSKIALWGASLLLSLLIVLILLVL